MSENAVVISIAVATIVGVFSGSCLGWWIGSGRDSWVMEVQRRDIDRHYKAFETMEDLARKWKQRAKDLESQTKEQSIRLEAIEQALTCEIIESHKTSKRG